MPSAAQRRCGERCRAQGAPGPAPSSRQTSGSRSPKTRPTTRRAASRPAAGPPTDHILPQAAAPGQPTPALPPLRAPAGRPPPPRASSAHALARRLDHRPGAGRPGRAAALHCPCPCGCLGPCSRPGGGPGPRRGQGLPGRACPPREGAGSSQAAGGGGALLAAGRGEGRGGAAGGDGGGSVLGCSTWVPGRTGPGSGGAVPHWPCSARAWRRVLHHGADVYFFLVFHGGAGGAEAEYSCASLDAPRIPGMADGEQCIGVGAEAQ